ncbi:hypothetical protein MCEGE10_02070 [Flavobacteriaceae bacterium]
METIKFLLLLTVFFAYSQNNAQGKSIKSSTSIINKKVNNNVVSTESKVNSNELKSENYILDSVLLQTIFSKYISKGYELQIETVDTTVEGKPMLQLSYWSIETN